MEFSGEFEVNANRTEVSSFVSDLNRVVSIIPEVQSFEKVTDRSARLTVKAGQSAIKGKFKLLLEIDSTNSGEVIEVSAKGSGATGSLDLKANYNITEAGDNSTIVRWTVNLLFGGVIATMGSRVIKGAAERYVTLLTDSFKRSFEK